MRSAIEPVRPGVWEVAPSGGMTVPARIYASDELLAAAGNDRSVEQVCVVVASHSPKTLAEEMPEAYKDAAAVVEALRLAGIARPVARLRPLGVVKG